MSTCCWCTSKRNCNAVGIGKYVTSKFTICRWDVISSRIWRDVLPLPLWDSATFINCTLFTTPSIVVILDERLEESILGSFRKRICIGESITKTDLGGSSRLEIAKFASSRASRCCRCIKTSGTRHCVLQAFIKTKESLGVIDEAHCNASWRKTTTALYIAQHSVEEVPSWLVSISWINSTKTNGSLDSAAR